MKTKDYSIFKFIAWNRRIDRGHVHKLKTAILENNMLADFPILVDEQMNIIDGQHRLEAAKELEIEIYYKIARAVKPDMVDKINSVSKRWNQHDYLNKHIKNGNEEYIKLKKFMEFSRINSPTLNATILLSGNTDKAANDTVKSGDFKYPTNTAHAYRIVNILHTLRDYGFEYWDQRNLALAFIKMVSIDTFNEEKFLKKLEYLSVKYRRCVSKNDYISVIEYIYNYKERNQIILS